MEEGYDDHFSTRNAGVSGQIKTAADLTYDWREEYEERAAIREFDGGQQREYAETDAFHEILQRMRRAGLKT